MRGVHLFMFIVLIPALAALGFDIYLFYMNQDNGFMLSTPGYLLTHYEPDAYKWLVGNTGDYWPYVNFVLAQKSVYIGVVFALFFWLLLGILKLLGLPPFRGEAANYSTGGIGSNRSKEILGGKTVKMKYKRK